MIVGLRLDQALWLFGGLVLGVIVAVWCARAQRTGWLEEGEWVPGLFFICAWVFAPLVAAGLAFVGVAAAISHGARALERKVPEHQSREALERRVADLERELLDA